MAWVERQMTERPRGRGPSGACRLSFYDGRAPSGARPPFHQCSTPHARRSSERAIRPTRLIAR